MFHPITIPFDCVMLFNRVHLKEGVTAEDIELELGEMCNVVKNTYRDDGGFIAGQVFEFTGFASEEGSINNPDTHEKHVAIMTKRHMLIKRLKKNSKRCLSLLTTRMSLVTGYCGRVSRKTFNRSARLRDRPVKS
jgi:hypothetical protein